MKNAILMTGRGLRESWSNLISLNSKTTVFDITDCIEDCDTGDKLVKAINALDILGRFELDRETDEYVRLKTVDYCGNASFLKAYK